MSKKRAKRSAPVMQVRKPASRTSVPVTEPIIVPPARRARKSRKQTMAELADAYRAVFAGPLGQRVKADLMAYCNVYHPIQGKDPFEVGQRLGERNVALRIAQMMGMRPEDFDSHAWSEAGQLDEMMA